MKFTWHMYDKQGIPHWTNMEIPLVSSRLQPINFIHSNGRFSWVFQTMESEIVISKDFQLLEDLVWTLIVVNAQAAYMTM